MKLVTLDELTALQAAGAPPLVDVRLEDDYLAGHIPGAKNVSVFNVSFLGELETLGCAKNQPIVVYGAGANSHESRMAAGKLERAGFSEIQEFRGGLEAWTTAGKPIEGTGQPVASDALTGTFSLDLKESRVEWLGRNLLNKHFGTIAIKSGHVTCRSGMLERGDFIIDMQSMNCTDITDSKMNQVLIDHLMSDDFFDVERYPEARFQIRKVEGVEGARPGLPDVRVSGELTLRGKVHPLVLFALTGVDSNGRFAAQAAFAFDRTLWGSIYGSGRFFKNVGMHLVNDLIEIQVRLVT